jgi:hypothetical protein
MSNIRLAYAHLNLRWNPFGEIDPEDVAHLAIVQVEQFVSRLQIPGFALQYLGDQGHGKTTHLLALHKYFPEAPYIHFQEKAPNPEIPPAPLLFLDETQRLPISLRKHLFSREASFVIGTHVDHSSEYKKAGLDYKSIHLKGMTIDQLEMIIHRRIEWARRDHGPVPTVSRAEIDRLITLYDDDLLAILTSLYEEIQSLEETTDAETYSPGAV